MQTATLTENSRMHGTEHLLGLLNHTNGYDEPVEVVYSYDEDGDALVGGYIVISRDPDGDYAFCVGDDPMGMASIHATLSDAVSAARLVLTTEV